MAAFFTSSGMNSELVIGIKEFSPILSVVVSWSWWYKPRYPSGIAKPQHLFEVCHPAWERIKVQYNLCCSAMTLRDLPRACYMVCIIPNLPSMAHDALVTWFCGHEHVHVHRHWCRPQSFHLWQVYRVSQRNLVGLNWWIAQESWKIKVDGTKGETSMIFHI